MIARLVIALFSSAWYGVLVCASVLPLILAVVAAKLALLTGIPDDPFASKAIVVTGLIGVGIAVLGIFLNIAVTVQMGRYAGAFCKYRAIREQPRFGKAFLRGALILFVVFVVTVILGASAVLGLRYVAADLGLPPGNQTAIVEWLTMLVQAADGRFSSEPGAAEAAFFIELSRLISMIYIMFLAMLIVPRVCGGGGERGHVWRIRWLVYRLFLALPYLAFSALILAELLMYGLNWVFGFALDYGSYFVIRLNLQLAFFTGLAFAHEALLLRSAREIREEAREILNSLERQRHRGRDPREIRAEWSRT